VDTSETVILKGRGVKFFKMAAMVSEKLRLYLSALYMLSPVRPSARHTGESYKNG